MLEIKKLSKTYNNSSSSAINDFSLKVKEGEICALVGRNGAGKTTILKCISGITDFSGEVMINKISLTTSPIEYKKMIAYLSDSPDIYEFLKGIDYLNMVCDIFKVNNREKKIKKYSDIFELTGFLGNTINTYSHGMKQKLSIIASLIHDPQVLFLDEPFNYLDTFGISKLKNVLKELTKEKVIVLYSTNKVNEAKKFSDKIAFIEKGSLINYGEYKEMSKELNEKMGHEDE